MAIPTPALMDMYIHGTGVDLLKGGLVHNVSLKAFFKYPEPGERNPWPHSFWWGRDAYDDGGGAAIAAYQYGLCSTAL